MKMKWEQNGSSDYAANHIWASKQNWFHFVAMATVKFHYKSIKNNQIISYCIKLLHLEKMEALWSTTIGFMCLLFSMYIPKEIIFKFSTKHNCIF